jgi:hypothetical protein
LHGKDQHAVACDLFLFFGYYTVYLNDARFAGIFPNAKLQGPDFPLATAKANHIHTFHPNLHQYPSRGKTENAVEQGMVLCLEIKYQYCHRNDSIICHCEEAGPTKQSRKAAHEEIATPGFAGLAMTAWVCLYI